MSEGIYDSLNCAYGTGDDEKNVDENYRIIARALGANAYCKAHQIHSNRVVTATAPWKREQAPQADAIVTCVPHLMIGITTADCLPILLADTTQPIIGAAHAGWKGAVTGVIEATVDAMRALGARNLAAAIGPAISQQSYEVGPEFYERFIQESTGNTVYFAPSARSGHYQFDLKAYGKSRLQHAGVQLINMLAHDTCLEEDAFFSYRRTVKRGESAYGCQLSAIMIG